MSVPSDLPEIGSTAQRLRQNPRFDPVAAGVGPEDYFVWTRFDGATTLKDLILMTGFATPKAVDIVRRLREVGAILLPGEAPEAVVGRLPATVAAGAAAPVAAAAAAAPAGDEPALAEEVDLGIAERLRILAMHRRIRGSEPLAILGATDATDRKAIKRAYFALSKEFHPDRFYGRRVGSFAARLTEIFEAVAHAYAAVTDGRTRRTAAGSPSPVSHPVDHAVDLFDRACQAEIAGDFDVALRLFAQTLRVAASARHLRRAARCALAASEYPLALEYAKKAAALEPNDPSTARLLAQAFKAVGKLGEAEEILVLALLLKTDNDQLTGELRADLAEVRRLATR
jgi:tetratricopeptide (TPR) repeat protein